MRSYGLRGPTLDGGVMTKRIDGKEVRQANLSPIQMMAPTEDANCWLKLSSYNVRGLKFRPPPPNRPKASITRAHPRCINQSPGIPQVFDPFRPKQNHVTSLNQSETSIMHILSTPHFCLPNTNLPLFYIHDIVLTNNFYPT